MKRPASAAASGAAAAIAPKTKARKITGPMAHVVEGLAASEVPPAVQAMLADMLVVSLGACKEQHSKYQQKVVDMVEEVFTSVDCSLQQKVQELEALVSQDAQSQEELNSKSAAKGTEIEAKHSEVLAKKKDLAEVAMTFKQAGEAVREAEAKGANVDKEAQCKAEERVSLVALREELQSGVEEKAKELVKRLAAFGISDTMLVAFPAVLAKPQAEWGSFDAIVLTSIADELDKRIAAVDEAIQNVEPTKIAMADSLQEAQAGREEVSTQQLHMAAAYQEVHGEEVELETEAAELRMAIQKLKEVSRKHATLTSKAKSNLDAFQAGPKHQFEVLRDATAEVVPESIAASGEGVAMLESRQVEVSAC